MHYADLENGDLAYASGSLGRYRAHGIYQLYPAICDRDGIVLWLWIIRFGRTLGSIFDCADHLDVSALDITHLAFQIPIWTLGMALAVADIFQISTDA